jgi:hypothetical protein
MHIGYGQSSTLAFFYPAAAGDYGDNDTPVYIKQTVSLTQGTVSVFGYL